MNDKNWIAWFLGGCVLIWLLAKGVTSAYLKATQGAWLPGAIGSALLSIVFFGAFLLTMHAGAGLPVITLLLLLAMMFCQVFIGIVQSRDKIPSNWD